MVSRALRGEIPPDVQPKPPLVQLEATYSCPVSGCLGKEAIAYFSTGSSQLFYFVVVMYWFKTKQES
ncbi:hypothetical protein DUI87_09885 [Hirundo rustica rustica]|uniref:Uncharacterized protein n=1 Tax=Hirundo rustica rustica TaxID=333673 RepID=A0A3M0KN18_HIRRU|nr:hypothetical protein DUI87_09885 [Hirundo rustica rustica]